MSKALDLGEHGLDDQKKLFQDVCLAIIEPPAGNDDNDDEEEEKPKKASKKKAATTGTKRAVKSFLASFLILQYLLTLIS